MNALGLVALFGWLLLAPCAFVFLPPRRAVIFGLVVAWMFLPVGSFEAAGLPNLDKITSANLAVLLGALLFDGRRLLGTRPRWFDLPMLAWCLSPLLSSLHNELGWYDGLAHALQTALAWGIPWWLGRVYLTEPAGLVDLAWAFCVGGLAYVPLCLWEIRMSPQLHETVYGFFQHDFSQTRRWDSFRPTVFMQHGLMVAMWMATATLMAWILWRGVGRKRIGPLPMTWAVVLLAGTTLLCKSLGAVLLLATGLVVFESLLRMRTTVLLWPLVLAPIAYIAVRSQGLWPARELVLVTRAVSPERAWSLEYRLDSEDLLAARAREQPIFGWGAWGRNIATRDEEGYDLVISDSQWIVAFGQQGSFGLACLVLVIVVPVARFWRRNPPASWMRGGGAGAGALAVLLLLFLVDDLVNGMYHPLYMLAAGGLAAARVPQRVAPTPAPARRRPAVATASG